MQSALFFLTMLASSLLAAPSSPSRAGVVEKQLEKEYAEQPQRESPSIQMRIPEKRLELKEGESVFVKKLEIQGNRSIPTGEICSWITCFLNRKLSSQEIDVICRRIEKGYIDKGYLLVSVYPPEQKVVHGILIIKVLEVQE